MTTQQTLTPQQARELIWRSGNIVDFLLDSNQKEIYNQYKDSKRKTQVVVLSRQSGKSYGLLTIAVQECLQRPNITVTYVAPRLNQGKKIVRSTFQEIFKTCPKDLRPEYKTQESTYVFSNGSRLTLGGFNAGEIEAQRGEKSHLVIIDEAAFCTELKYGLRSVLFPKLNTTRGKMLMCSTLPKSASHEYWEIVKKAELDGTLLKRDIYSCPRYTKEDIDGFAEEVGGYDSIDFQREYLNIMITDSESAVIPEATEQKIASLVMEWKRPAFFDAYVSMDIGFKDYTAILFGYYDFLKAKFVFEDEILLKGNKVTTHSVSTLIKQKEEELWGIKKPYLRIADNNNPIFTNELAMIPHEVPFMLTAKDDKEAAISKLRMLIQQDRIIINPKCKMLINHLKYATWNSKRTSFDRDLQNGHFDCLDSSIYMIRNVQMNKNPYPNNYFLPEGTLFNSQDEYAPKNQFQADLKEMFNPWKHKKR